MEGLDLRVRGVEVKLEGYPGCTVRRLLSKMEIVMERLYGDGFSYNADVVVLSIGGNDLCNQYLTCEQFVEDLIEKYICVYVFCTSRITVEYYCVTDTEYRCL